MSRKYYPVWKKLKEKKECMLSAHPLLFARIIKGVIKEKDRDVAFKIANDFDSLYLKVERDADKHIIKFKLKQRIGLENIVVV